MISEYSNLTDAQSDLNANGTKTLSEDIADNGKTLNFLGNDSMRIIVGGMKLSYRYFTTHINASGAQLTLPNINFTLNQLFWILSGQVWCSTHDSGF